MQVIIDGVEYAPKDNRVTVHGIEYENIPNWLLNIHATLLSDWVNAVKEDGGIYCKGLNARHDALNNRVNEFEKFCKEFLGFETKEGEIGFFEVKEK